MFRITKWLSVIFFSLCSTLQASSINYNNIYKYSVQHNYTNNKYYAVVDFTKPSTEKRLFIYDSTSYKIVFSTYVAHGSGSGEGEYAKTFSNVENSKATSLGVFRTVEWYQSDTHGMSLRVQGLEKGINDNAYDRFIEVHGAKYIGNGNTGHSWGCFAVPFKDLKTVESYLKPQAIIISYYPDNNWLHNSVFVNAK